MTELKVGDAAPVFKTVDEAGNPVSLGDLKEGKIRELSAREVKSLLSAT